MPTIPPPTDTDRELAREWADAQSWLDREQRRLAENAYALGLAAGWAGPTWTGTPPDREGWWWRRYRTADVPEPVLVKMKKGVLYIDGGPENPDMSVAFHVKSWPACQWSPISAPREPT